MTHNSTDRADGYRAIARSRRSLPTPLADNKRVELMVNTILTAAVGLICTLLGMLVGWYLGELSRARKERTDSYREALSDVRRALEAALDATRGKELYSFREVYFKYLLSLGRLEPYIKYVGSEKFEQLRDLLRGEMFPSSPEGYIVDAIDTINQLLSEHKP